MDAVRAKVTQVLLLELETHTLRHVHLHLHAVHRIDRIEREHARVGDGRVRDGLHHGRADISEVSGGQLQRACICRSLINRPSIVFADEPTGALNRSASESVLSMMEQINEEGTTIVMVTHDMHVASKCGRILYIEDGNIKGELSLKDKKKEETKAREHVLSAWLSDMEW